MSNHPDTINRQARGLAALLQHRLEPHEINEIDASNAADIHAALKHLARTIPHDELQAHPNYQDLCTTLGTLQIATHYPHSVTQHMALTITTAHITRTLQDLANHGT